MKVRILLRLLGALSWTTDSAVQLAGLVNDVNEYIIKFSRIPLPTRHFLGQFAMRMEYLSQTHGLYRDSGSGEFMHVTDVETDVPTQHRRGKDNIRSHADLFFRRH